MFGRLPLFSQISQKCYIDKSFLEIAFELNQDELIKNFGYKTNNQNFAEQMDQLVELFTNKKIADLIDDCSWSQVISNLPLQVSLLITETIENYLYPLPTTNSSILCSCFNVSIETLSGLVKKNPEITFTDIQQATFCGLGCDTCLGLIQNLYQNKYFHYQSSL